MQKCNGNMLVFFMMFTLISPVYNAVNSIVMGLAAVGVIYLLKKKEVYFSYRDIERLWMPYSIFIGGIIISSIAIMDMKSLEKAMDFFYWSLPLFILYILMQSQESLEYFYGGIFASAVFTSGYSVYQYFWEGVQRASSLYGHPNHFATLLDLSLPLVIVGTIYGYSLKKWYWKISGLISGIVGCVSVYATGSRGALLGVLLGGSLVFLLYMYKKWRIRKHLVRVILWGSIFLLFMGSVYFYNLDYFHRSYDNERILLLQSSYQMWSEHKLWGVGLNNWATEYQSTYILPEAREPNLDMPHNVLAFFFSATGIVGGVGFFIFQVGVFKLMIEKVMEEKEGCLLGLYLGVLWAVIAVFIHGLLDTGITMKGAMRLYMGLIGVALGYKYKVQDD